MSVDALAAKFPRYAEWERGEAKPTLKQLEKFADAAHVAFGSLFLDSPPEEYLPIPDFRTLHNRQLRHPSPDLFDMILICQQRQDWYRDHCVSEEYDDPLPFIGSVTRRQSVKQVAASIRETIGFDLKARSECRTWEAALKHFITAADEAGVLVMCSGIVRNNTRRKLKVEEFRGFTLADDIAPLIFINGSDTKSAQMFTLAHELAHLWLGQSALSTAHINRDEEQKIEQWCNAVAAEILVPLDVLRDEVNAGEPVGDAVKRLARRFKVSALVILRRLFDIGIISRPDFRRLYDAELQRLTDLADTRGGGNFYLSQATRLSRRFACALVENVLEGGTLHRDALHLLGYKRLDTFDNLGRSLGYPI